MDDITKLVITGPPGTGTSTVTKRVAALLSDELDRVISTWSSGRFCRHLSKQAGYADINEFNRAMIDTPDPSFDEKIDGAVLDTLASPKSVVLDSRLGAWFGSTNVYTVRLTCDKYVAAQRIFQREYRMPFSGETASIVNNVRKNAQNRFDDENLRFKATYQYDPGHPVNLEIDTTSLKPWEITQLIAHNYLLWRAGKQ